MKKERTTGIHGGWVRTAVLAVLVGAAAVLWWTDGRKEADLNAPPEPVPTVYSDERLKRETAFNRDVTALQALVENETADEATRQMAAQQLTAIVEQHSSEVALETALLEAGYQSAVVLVHNGSVTVMLPEDQLTEETSAQILALCLAHTNADADNIRIMASRV